MESAALLKSIFSLLFVIGLIGILSLLAKKYGPGRFLLKGFVKNPKNKRLQIIETLPLDARRKLLLIKRDGTEHLLLLGASQDLLIERGIRKPRRDQGREYGID